VVVEPQGRGGGKFVTGKAVVLKKQQFEALALWKVHGAAS
jgi:hypothetical protein